MSQSSNRVNPARRAGLRLALIIGLYLMLAVAYSVVVPIGRGADEWAHYWYAQFIAQNQRLPANPAEREAAGYKSDWPPLYHFFAAAVTGWVETEGPPTFKYRADSIRRQLAPAQGSDAILHTEDERFPWQQEILVWHLGRFLSISFSAITLLFTWFIALEVFSIVNRKSKIVNPQTLALIAVATLAFNPRFLFTGMLFNYDSLTLLLSSLFLWLSIRIASGYHLHWGFWALGLLAGLALISKYLAAPLLLVIVLLAWWSSTETGPQTNKLTKQQQNSEEANAPQTTPHVPRTTHYALRTTLSKLLQSAIAFLLVTGWWFAYLLINFNEMDTYGPLLGTLAPLIRGDGSDRTVEQLFSWLSGGQAPSPAVIQQQTYTAGQIIGSFFITLWGNAVTRPYPLNWFIVAMTLVTFSAVIGLVLIWRGLTLGDQARRLVLLLSLYCLLPVPFMAVRLLGARDALEAVQGRHILFLAAPAVAVLLIAGLNEVVRRVALYGKLPVPLTLSFTFSAFIALLLVGAVAQLVVMRGAYPPLLPVSSVPYQTKIPFLEPVRLEGGAELLEVNLTGEDGPLLQVEMLWQAGDTFAPEDYQVEMALVNLQGEVVSHWQAYQTQARYPTRMWESGDIVRDTGWLPLVDLPPGEYEVQLRLMGRNSPLTDWMMLETIPVSGASTAEKVKIWQQGEARTLPVFRERETILITTSGSGLDAKLIGPDGVAVMPVASGAGWANFIVEPHWPAGAYTLNGKTPLLQIAKSPREFQIPAISHPLDVNFAGKIKLLGYNLPTRRIEPGQKLPLLLTWQALDWMGEEFVLFDRLLDNQGLVWGGYDRMALENYSTLLWAPGQIIADGFAIPVDPDAPDGVYTINLGWYRGVEGQAESLPIIDPATGQPTGQTAITIGPIKIGGPPDGVTIENAAPQVVVNQTLGDTIKLLGYDLEIDDASQMTFTLYWQALASPERDYTVFVHLRNSTGEVVAQKDRPPVDGIYPTGLWDADEIIKDALTVPFIELSPGKYKVVVGMYNLGTGERLPVAGSADGTILLQMVEVGK